MHGEPVSIAPLAERAILRPKAGFEIQEAAANRAPLIARTKALASRADGKALVDVRLGNLRRPGKPGERLIKCCLGEVASHCCKRRQIGFAPDVGIPFAMGARGTWVRREVNAFRAEAQADFHDHWRDRFHAGTGNPFPVPSSGGV